MEVEEEIFDGIEELALFQSVTTNASDNKIHESVQLALEYAHNFENQQDFLNHIASLMPRARLSGIGVLMEIPQFCYKYWPVTKVIARHVTNIVMEKNHRDHRQARCKFGKFLLRFLFASRTTELGRLINDDDRVNLLRYVDLVVKPALCLRYKHLSNAVFTKMAKEVSREKFDEFFKVMLQSHNFSIYNMMNSLSERFSDGVLNNTNAFKFLDLKKATRRPDFLPMHASVRDAIEFEFVRELLRYTKVDQLEQIIVDIKQKGYVTEDMLDNVTKIHLTESAPLPEPNYTDDVIDGLVRQSILTREFHLAHMRNEIVERALKLTPHYEVFSPDERKKFFAVLASQSFPKGYCKHKGDQVLFRILIKRLLEMMPTLEQNEICVDLNEYQSVIYCLYNLYVMDEQLKATLYDIDSTWRLRLLHAVDLHVITSGNLQYFMKRERNEAVERSLRQRQDIVTNAGQLLVFLFGVLNHRPLKVVPSYMNNRPFFRGELFTTTFTTEFNVLLSKIQTKPGRRITYPHRNGLRVFEPEWMDSDDEEDSDTPSEYTVGSESSEDQVSDHENVEYEESDENDYSDSDETVGEAMQRILGIQLPANRVAEEESEEDKEEGGAEDDAGDDGEDEYDSDDESEDGENEATSDSDQE